MRRFALTHLLAAMVAAALVCPLSPAHAVTATGALEIPEGFELQVLEPAGGRIARPANWFYRERHSGGSHVWIISREDPDLGPYQTGMKIQLLIDVTDLTGWTPRDFVAHIVSQKRAHTKVIRHCGEEPVGLFLRQCLETEEAADFSPSGAFRIVYSLFYNDELDVVVLNIFGAPTDAWDEASVLLGAMSEFELIDMSRFAEDEADVQDSDD
jgi:hypothetical protein